MNIAILNQPTKTFSSRTILKGFAAGLTLAAALPLGAQQIHTEPLLQTAPPLLATTLPNSPGATLFAEKESSSSISPNPVDFGTPSPVSQPMASTTDKYIAPGQSVPTLTVGNKIALGIKDAISPFSAIGWAISAGYAQGLDNSPNYGTNGKAFAQRFGASAARATSEGIFSDSIMASVLHEDPRYYRMGPGHNVLKRAAYAGTRAIITRTDSGRTTPNFALLSGNLAGSYLTKAYYPPLNQSNTEVFKTFGGSIGGSALGFVVSEFLSGALNIFHSSKPAAN